MNSPLWISNLVSWSAQVAVLTIAAGLLARVFQLRRPRVLLVCWRALIAVSLLLPLLQPWHHPPRAPAIVLSSDLPVSTLSAPSTPSAQHWHLPSTELAAEVIGILILVGIAVRLVFLSLGLLKLHRLRRSSSPMPTGSESTALLEGARAELGARAEFRLSPDVDSPVTFGFASPVILLPERFPTLDPRFQAAITWHELLHVRRCDWAHHLSEEFLCAAFWFHPAIAWLVSRVRLAREQVVDLEVVRRTQRRKPYLEALLEFTDKRRRLAAVPAPPFLAERQLVERIALMVKEVQMSRRRLCISLTTASCCLVLVVFFAARMFPLKAALKLAQNVVEKDVAGRVSGAVAGGISNGVSGGVAQGVANGVANGVSGGVRGGVSGETRAQASSNIPNVDYSAIWVDTVKSGPMVRQVRGLGKFVSAGDSTLLARITVPVYLTVDVRPNQSAAVDTRMGVVKGHVVSINPSGDTCSIDIALDAALPERATVGLSIDATIELGTLENVLHVARPVHSVPNASITLLKIAPSGSEAQRVTVKFGRLSVNSIEILGGLQAGDKIILSDMSDYDNADRIRLTNNMR